MHERKTWKRSATEKRDRRRIEKTNAHKPEIFRRIPSPHVELQQAHRRNTKSLKAASTPSRTGNLSETQLPLAKNN